MPKLYRYVFRDADTGQWVSKAYALAHPKTTIRQRLWFWQEQK